MDKNKHENNIKEKDEKDKIEYKIINNDIYTNKNNNKNEVKKSEENFNKNEITLNFLKQKLRNLTEERDWDQYHTPRNLLLALVGEVGELSEIFQWKGEIKNTEDWSEKEKIHLGEEISDVLLYLIRLADKCDIDINKAVIDKLNKNKDKYPVEKFKGSSKKYNEYDNDNDNDK